MEWLIPLTIIAIIGIWRYCLPPKIEDGDYPDWTVKRIGKCPEKLEPSEDL